MATAADAGTTASARQQQQAAALFKAKHAELLWEARGVAFEFGVNVRAIACRPGGGGVAHDFMGAERVADSIARAVARDVSAMGLEQVTEHERKLRRMRALVARALQVREANKAKDDDAAVAPAAAAGGGASKRALGQQEMTMMAADGGGGGAGGSNKTRRTG